MHNAEDRGDLARENMWPWLMIVIILAAVAISVAGFFLSPLASLQALFVAVGVAIVCFSVGRFGIENAALRRRTIGRAALLQVLEHDPDHAFLTDAEGNIVSWNKLASDKFGDVEGKSIGAVFTTILANPDAVLFRLLERADISG
ncbi:MAG: two-component system cell cycle sensor histidine kinase/response regulator CckA, partial [Yoonia sp.]